MRAVFHTLGCKVNQYETQAMRQYMESAGFETGDRETTVENLKKALEQFSKMK